MSTFIDKSICNCLEYNEEKAQKYCLAIITTLNYKDEKICKYKLLRSSVILSLSSNQKRENALVFFCRNSLSTTVLECQIKPGTSQFIRTPSNLPWE